MINDPVYSKRPMTALTSHLSGHCQQPRHKSRQIRKFQIGAKVKILGPDHLHGLIVANFNLAVTNLSIGICICDIAAVFSDPRLQVSQKEEAWQ